MRIDFFKTRLPLRVKIAAMRRFVMLLIIKRVTAFAFLSARRVSSLESLLRCRGIAITV